MHSLLTANEYLLRAVGWGIVNSFWQTGLLWITYQFIAIINVRPSAIFKHNLSLLFLFASLVWFVDTIIETYHSTANSLLDPDPIHFINSPQLGSLLPFLSAAYILLLCFFAIRFINSYRRTIALRGNELLKAPLALRMFAHNTALHIGIKKKAQVWVSEHIDVPSVIGFIKPMILLPAAVINHLSAEQLEAILLHELAHIKRNDYVVNLFQSIVETILFFNPFALLLSSYAKKERENCCDDWVMNYQYNRHDYANALLLLEEQRRQHLVLAMAATNEKSFLLKRIKRLFTNEPATTVNIFQRVQMAVIAVILLVGISCLFLSPSFNTAVNKRTVPLQQSSTNFFDRHPSIFIYPAGNKVIVSNNVIPAPVRYPVIKKNKAAERIHTNKLPDDYTVALINSDLLKKNEQPATIITNVSDNETDTAQEYYIKVEEEHSGNPQTNTYYFNLKKDNGNTSIEPIMILKKHIHKKDTKKHTGTAVAIPKRITS